MIGQSYLPRIGTFAKTMVLAAVSLALSIVSVSSVDAQDFGANDSASVQLQGFTEARQSIVVSAPLQGRIEAVDVQMGDLVHAGDTLVRLDATQSKLNFEVAEIQAAATGEIELAAADVEIQSDRYEKLLQLGREQLARPDEITRSLGLLRQARARLKVAEEAREIKRGEKRRAKLQLDMHTIVAPVDGLIGEVLHRQGEWVSPGDASLVTLLATDQLDAVLNVRPEHLPWLLTAGPLTVHLVGAGEFVPAKVYQVSPAINGQSGTIEVRLTIDNPDRIYRVGDQCTLTLRRSTEAPMDHSAIRSDDVDRPVDIGENDNRDDGELSMESTPAEPTTLFRFDPAMLLPPYRQPVAMVEPDVVDPTPRRSILADHPLRFLLAAPRAQSVCQTPPRMGPPSVTPPVRRSPGSILSDEPLPPVAQIWRPRRRTIQLPVPRPSVAEQPRGGRYE